MNENHHNRALDAHQVNPQVLHQILTSVTRSSPYANQDIVILNLIHLITCICNDGNIHRHDMYLYINMREVKMVITHNQNGCSVIHVSSICQII